MWNENRAQTAMEALLVVGIVIVIATIAGLIMKGLFTQVQTDVQNQANTVVNQTN
ncbi:MAG: class III signal peptide-containing protein [Candidatus Diapherotrites archaeon]|uniref:Class III signal peptide-containing protein n=1 Tax=Candidatus Iainarchaeum sp. TaxID=3101447 RepID=A0A8T4C6C1_9ARCH|nr:class III signal peptide-containing protein [Candidatus Diapherotrites archaeon]